MIAKKAGCCLQYLYFLNKAEMGMTLVGVSGDVPTIYMLFVCNLYVPNLLQKTAMRHTVG